MKKWIVKPAALAVAGLVAGVPAWAQEARKGERIEVTGSAIKRVDAEGPAPVEIITREDIKRTGATSVNELIKSIPVIDVFDQGELASNSPGGSGSARVRLRGLGDTQTLVLVNGRRVPKNPLDDATGAGHAFDLNQLPLSAIERVEILKDGGSAIYGADAVAGVINFILRKDYRGVEGRVMYGQSSRSDGEEQQYGLTAGFGELARDRYNVLFAVDVFKRDPIYRKDRDISSSVDFRRFGPLPGFNLDGRSSFAPEGNILTPQGTFSGQTVRPCAPENFSSGVCRYDFNATLLTAYNGADRWNALGVGTVQVTPDITAAATVMYSRSEDLFEAHPVPDFFLLPDGRSYAGRFMQGGPRITEREAEFLNTQLALEGTHRSIDWTVGVAHGESKVTNQDRNYFDRARWNAALRSGALDATTNNNDPAFVESLKVSPQRSGSSKLTTLDGKFSGEIFNLPGGPARYAVGASWWNEDLADNPDPLQIAGQVVGSIQQTQINRDRDATGAFAELQLPVLRNVEAQVAVRYDKYDTANATSPKAAVLWRVVPQFLVRGSYSESFKMPSLKQLYGNAGQGAINLTSEQCQAISLPSGCNLPAFRVTGSNPDLQPETGETYNLGFVADIGRFSFGVEWWRVEKEDNITTPTILSALQQGFFFYDASNRLNVLQNLQNFAQSHNEGYDVEARVTWPGTLLGNLTFRATGTYYTHQRTRTTTSSPWAEFNTTYATPRWRSLVTIGAERGPWTAQAAWRTTSGYYDTVQPVQNFGLLAFVPKVGNHEELDLTLSWSGIRNLTLSAAVKNALDRMPPFSATNGTNNNFTQLGFAELYTNRGRFYQVGVQYAFR